MGRRALLLIAAILVAATGTGVVALYAKTADRRAGELQESVQVWVAKGPIPIGTKGEQLADLVVRKPYAKAFVPEDYVSNLAALKGLVASIAIPANRPLQKSLFSKPAESTAPNELGLAEDTVAVAVTIADNARVAGYVVDGSYVALYVQTGGKEAAGEVLPLLRRPVRVLKVANNGAKGPSSGSTNVTLELSLDEAPMVIFASSNDSLYMALLPSKDVSLENATKFGGTYPGAAD